MYKLWFNPEAYKFKYKDPSQRVNAFETSINDKIRCLACIVDTFNLCLPYFDKLIINEDEKITKQLVVEMQNSSVVLFSFLLNNVLFRNHIELLLAEMRDPDNKYNLNFEWSSIGLRSPNTLTKAKDGYVNLSLQSDSYFRAHFSLRYYPSEHKFSITNDRDKFTYEFHSVKNIKDYRPINYKAEINYSDAETPSLMRLNSMFGVSYINEIYNSVHPTIELNVFEKFSTYDVVTTYLKKETKHQPSLVTLNDTTHYEELLSCVSLAAIFKQYWINRLTTMVPNLKFKICHKHIESNVAVK